MIYVYVSVNSSGAHPPPRGISHFYVPPQGKKNCANAPPLGKQIRSISPPLGNNIDCLHVDLHVMYRSIRNFNMPPPRADPGNFNFLKFD
jgi:hypothetical protein